MLTTYQKHNTVAAFEDAARNAHDIIPNEVFTDSLRHYNSGVKVFPNAKRIKDCGLGKQYNHNNRIERLNGTLRERAKVQRGYKTAKTPIAEGLRIHYNFIKPHMALDGQTPAQAAGLNVRGWNDLLKLASSKHRER